jgi:hypothetical protein
MLRLAIVEACYFPCLFSEKRGKCQIYLSGQSRADGQRHIFCSHFRDLGTTVTLLNFLAHTKKTPYSHSLRNSTCLNWIFRFFPSGTHTSHVLHLSIQGCTNTGRLIASTTKFCMVERNIFNTLASIFYLYVQKVYQFTQPSRKRQNNSDGQRSPQSCVSPYGSSCHHSGTQNLDVADSFLENLFTSDPCHAI